MKPLLFLFVLVTVLSCKKESEEPTVTPQPQPAAPAPSTPPVNQYVWDLLISLQGRYQFDGYDTDVANDTLPYGYIDFNPDGTCIVLWNRYQIPVGYADSGIYKYDKKRFEITAVSNSYIVGTWQVNTSSSDHSNIEFTNIQNTSLKAGIWN